MAAAWYKADALGLANTATVSTWPDSSLGGKTLTPASTSPTFSTTNFTPGAVAFNSNPVRNAASAVLSSVTAYTQFVVYKQAGTGVSQAPFSTTSAAAQVFVTGGETYSFTSAGVAGHFTSDTTAKHIHEVVFDGSQTGNAARLVVLQEGTPMTQTFVGTIPAVTDAPTGVEVGSVWAETNLFVGDVAEVLIYARVLTAAQRSAIRVALGAKYSITVTP